MASDRTNYLAVYIGPTAKSLAAFLHYQMKIPYRKIRLLFHELFHLDFNPSSCPGFDRQIRNKGSPLYAELCQRLKTQPKNLIVRKADLTARLRRALRTKLAHPRADKFLRKLSGKFQELVACLDDPKVCAHNNIAERLLRDNVIMRKITFGNRSDNGMRNHEVLISLIQTARLHNLNPLPLLRLLLTQPAAAPAAFLSPLS